MSGLAAVTALPDSQRLESLFRTLLDQHNGVGQDTTLVLVNLFPTNLFNVLNGVMRRSCDFFPARVGTG